MDTQRLLEIGARGMHLLFDERVIAEAFEQQADVMRSIVDAELESIQGAVQGLLELPDAAAGRAYIAGLPRRVQYVIVLLYFELLDGSLRQRSLTLH